MQANVYIRPECPRRDGDWYFDPAFGDPDTPYSDIVIYYKPAGNA